MKNVLYIVNQRIPTEKAYGIQIAKMCEAFGSLGLNVFLIAPYRIGKIKNNIFEYYGVKSNFKFKKIFSPDFYLPGKLDRLAFYTKNIFSVFILAFYALSHKADIIYSRDELPLYILSFFKKNLVFEIHKFSAKKMLFYKRFKKLNLKIIAVSKGNKDELLKLGFRESNIIIAHDGVDLKEFNIDLSKGQARSKLSLPQDKKLIGYVGQLRTMGMEKGIDLAIKSLKSLPENVNLVLIGGSKDDINFYKTLSKSENLIKRVIFKGSIRHDLIPFYLKAFDVLTMPFPYNRHYAFYMSPLKLFEYMASKRPIVATDLPSVLEILNEKNSVLVKPDDPNSLSDAINKFLNSPEFSKELAEKAFEDVKNYTWQKRAGRIFGFIT